VSYGDGMLQCSAQSVNQPLVSELCDGKRPTDRSCRGGGDGISDLLCCHAVELINKIEEDALCSSANRLRVAKTRILLLGPFAPPSAGL
jgi:hypothetical protein